MNAVNTLPDIPSALIRLALADLDKAEQTPGYEIDMDRWHSPQDGKCLICLAGAVMAFSLNTPKEKCYSDTSFSRTSEQAFSALDSFRAGDIPSGLYVLGFKCHRQFTCRHITPYVVDPAQFKADMLQLAADLEEAGL